MFRRFRDLKKVEKHCSRAIQQALATWTDTTVLQIRTETYSETYTNIVIGSLGICGFDYSRTRKQGKTTNNEENITLQA